MTKFDLTAKQSTQLFFSNLLGTLKLDGRLPLRVSEEDGLFMVSMAGRRVAVPSAKRWRNYKRGWDKRLQKLSHQFGFGDVATVKPGDTVVDIGANIGEFSIAAANKGAIVHAIEGDPLVFRCLEFNTKAVDSIKRHQNVVWKEDTQLTFYSEPTDANSSVFRPMGDAPISALQVTAFRLDTLARDAGIGDVAFLKCDAEGAEPEVIEGGRELLQRTRVVAFDTGAERLGEETSADCEKLLTALGFAVHHEWRSHRKITFGIRT
ncbi:MAG: FkbM family methyltransferase [Tabrizicola sp.]